MNEGESIQGRLPRLAGIASTDIRFDRVPHGIHAGRGGDVRGEFQGEFGVEHRIVGNQAETVDGILLVRLAVADHGGQRHLAAGSGGGGHRDQGRNLEDDLENPFQFLDRHSGPGNPRADGLRAIDRGPPSERDDGLAVVLVIERQSRLDVLNRRVGDGAVINDILAAIDAEFRDQAVQQAQLHQGASTV